MKTTRDPHTFTAEQSTHLRAHVRDQMRAQTDASLGLAKALFEVYYGTTKEDEKPLALSWGFADFDEFAEKELLMHGGTARSYVRVYDELCVRRQFDEGTLPPSITALRELSKVSRKLTDKRELDRWIKRAHELTACEFKDAVDVEIHGKARRMKSIGFYMSWGAAGRVLKRIREARETYGFSTNGEALERILNDYTVGKPTAADRARAKAS